MSISKLEKKSIVRDILAVSKTLDMYEDGCIEIQLRLFDDSYTLHIGDSQYLTDHRGYWSEDLIDDSLSIRQAIELVNDMVADVEDSREEDETTAALIYESFMYRGGED